MNPNVSVKFECERCSNILIYSGSEIEMEAISSEERNMGPEIYYSGNCTYICPTCENEIFVTHNAWEYPVGAFNYGETKVMGGILVEGFKDLDFALDDEIYSFEKQPNLYLPEQKKIITSLEHGISNLITEILLSPEKIYTIDPREFEEIIAHVFNKAGFDVELTKKTRDGGRDIIALKYDLEIPLKFIIECKRWAKDRPISVDIVRALYGAQMQEGANKSVIATTSHYSPDAKKFALTTNTTEWSMSLKDHSDVMTWLKQASK